MLKKGIVAVILFAVVFFSLAPTATFAQDEVALPTPTGPYQIGQAEYYLMDESRQEIFTDDPDDVRELLLTVYYPAVPAPDAQPALYIVNETVRESYAVNFQPGFLDEFYTHSYVDAPLTTAEPNFPVLVYSSGLGSSPFGMTSIVEELVSHGYIVVGLWHPYTDAITVFPDGHTAQGNAAGQQLDFVVINEVWVEDTVFVLNQLEELNASDALLADSMDLSRAGIFGWSLGGATAVYALQRDERLLAGAMLDHAPIPDMSDGLQQPALLMRSEEYPLEETFINSVDQGYHVQIAGSTHMIFSDVPIFLPGFAFPLDVGEIAPLRGAELVNAYMLAFFDKYLKGYESPLLDEVPPEYEEVTFEVIE